MELSKNILILRREEEAKIGHPISIFTAHPLIGRGSVIHNMLSHEEVEMRFNKALSFSFKQKISFWLRKVFFSRKESKNAEA